MKTSSDSNMRAITIGSVAAATVIAATLIAVDVLALGSPEAAARVHASQSGHIKPRLAPKYDPAKFTARISNAWFPLKPGITYVYKGRDTDGRMRDVFRVTDKTITIAGVECRVIIDKVYTGGLLEESTKDYYTQDEDGNVWYFGEDTKELDEKGNIISREGSWRTGRNGAEAGIFMQANPQVGDTFQQEFYRGHAEDHYVVLSLRKSIKVPYGTFGRNPLRRSVELTKEWTPLEPNVRDHKFYVRGIGEVKEMTVRGPLETMSLVKIVKR